MSKHLGNSPDPLVVIRERGRRHAAVRARLPEPGRPGRAVRRRPPSTRAGTSSRSSGTWSGSPSATSPRRRTRRRRAPVLDPGAALEDRWILSRWAAHRRGARPRRSTPSSSPGPPAALYDFLWHDLADRYVEAAKEALLGSRGRGRPRRESEAVLLFVLDRTAPRAPPVRSPRRPRSSGMLARPARPTPSRSPPGRRRTRRPGTPRRRCEMATLIETVRALRNLRSGRRSPRSATPSPRRAFRASSPEVARVLLRSPRRSDELARSVARARSPPDHRAARRSDRSAP